MLVECILYVGDQNKSTAFYSQALGIAPSMEVLGMTEFSISENFKLGLMPEQGIANIICPIMPQPASGSGIPRCELYLKDEAEKMQSIFDRAQTAGAVLISPFEERDWGDTVAYMADLDGHVLALAYSSTK